jgi:hypothetical protein
MRRLPLFSLAFLLFAVGCESVQSPGELTLQTRSALDVLPGDVTMVSMVNVERARASEAFDAFTDGGFSMNHMTGEGAARFNDFMEATGFNPEEDIERVYFAARTNEEKAAPAFVVYADYDRSRLDAYIDEQADLELERSTYADAPVYLTQKNDEEMAFALVNDDMIVAGSRAEVYAMLDRLADGSKGLSGNAAMMALVDRAGHPDDLWMALRDLPTDGANAAADDAFHQAGRMMENAVFSAGFQRDGVAIKALGLTRADVNTRDVADLVRGAVATMKMGAKSDRATLETLDRVDVREVRGGVEVETFVSQEALREMRDGRDI